MSEFSRAAVLQLIETSTSGASENQTLRRIERRLQAVQSMLQEIRNGCCGKEATEQGLDSSSMS
jgi:hypothetical protein